MTRRVITARDQVALLAPWRIAIKIVRPEGLSITQHPGHHAWELAGEVRQQKGPRVLYDALNSADVDDPDQYLYVARDPQGTIHGVATGYYDDNDMDIHEVYTGLKAPQGTGGAMIQTMAQHALENGHRLNVKHVMDHPRRYWQELGADIPEGEIDGTWSQESHQALANGTPRPAAFTKVKDDDGNLIDPLDSTRTQVKRQHRLPGSIT